MSKNINVPKLRFKEFSGEWEEKVLDNIATFSKGKGISKADINENGTIECIRYGQLYTIYNELIKDIVSKTNVNENDLILSNYGDIIIPASGETQIDIARLSQDISVVHLYSSQLKTLKLNLPKKQEQEKIASFLTSIDTKIEQLTKKESLLKEYKKGVMQKIFNQEIRFRDDDGSEFCEWEEKKLKELSLTYYQGINTTADNVQYFKKGYPILQAKHITNEFIDFFDTKYLHENDYNKYKPNKNDILISNIGTLGKVVLIEEDVDFLVAWNIFKITLNLKKVNSKYLMFIIKKISSEGYFERMKTGNATKEFKKALLQQMFV